MGVTSRCTVLLCSVSPNHVEWSTPQYNITRKSTNPSLSIYRQHRKYTSSMQVMCQCVQGMSCVKMEASTVIVSYVATDVCVVDGRLVVACWEAGWGGGGGDGPP